MNNNYYPNNPYLKENNLNQNPLTGSNSTSPYESNQYPNAMFPNTIPDEQSYIENILRLNKGKKARFHVTVPGSVEWQDRVFEGIIEQSGKDHIIVSNPNTGEWYLVLMIYLDFVTFEEPINYKQEFYLPTN